MGTGRTDGFRKDAVRIALTSGLSRKQIADDLGVGMSTQNKWITALRDTDVGSHEDRELALENGRLGPAPVSFRSGAHVTRPFVRRPRVISSRGLSAFGAGCRSR